jgi:hypothetical protein
MWRSLGILVVDQKKRESCIGSRKQGYKMKLLLVTILVLAAISELRADDTGIPTRCRPKEAMDVG